MATHTEALATAIQHHKAGQLQAAEQIYRQVLLTDPSDSDALHGLGMIADQAGNHVDAVALFARAIKQKPNDATFHNDLGNANYALNKLPEAIASYHKALFLAPDFAEAHCKLGKALRKQGKLGDAVASYTRALELKPDFAEAHCNMGTALQEQGKLNEAVASYRKAIEQNPEFVEAHGNLGTVLQAQGNIDDAVECYRRAIELNPQFADAYSNLGIALQARGKLEEAIACYGRAIELKPIFAEAHGNLGIALQQQGKADEAVESYHRAIELKPDFAEVHGNLGIILCSQGKMDEAIASFYRAIELKPEFADAHGNLGLALHGRGILASAIASYHRAIELKPDFADVYSNLGNALKDQGHLDEAVECYRRALEFKPEFVGAYNNFLYTLQYFECVSLASILEAHREFDQRYGAPLRGTFAPRQPAEHSNRRLRLGFVSPDWGRHPIGFFLIGVIEQLQHEPVEVIVYSDRTKKDEYTERFRRAATQWHDVVGISDERLAEQIHDDRIDILFDLTGHTANNRLQVFARKPAAVQITWAGYVGTTGLEAMDYIIADCHEIPSEADKYYQEKVLRMPDGYVCYEPPAYAPTVTSLPALKCGHVTFGCFNNPTKITPLTIEYWTRILQRLPKSRLVLKSKVWNDDSTAKLFAAKFGDTIDRSRIDLKGDSSHVELLAEYNHIDLALDPFPYSGGLTTCEALWMGVPVITCPGETFASRHSLSHLSNVGLTETIARTLDEYVEIAVALASDLPRLASLRAGLRERMAKSPLCDGKLFATNLLSILRTVWDCHSNVRRGVSTGGAQFEELATAVRHHQAGQLPAAEQIYRKILDTDPNHPQALHGLGTIANQVGQYQAAVDLFGRAVQMKPGEAAFHNSLGGALLALKRLPEAIAAYRRTLELDRENVDAHNNLGNALKECGQLDEAVTCFRKAVQFGPNFAEAHNNLGNALYERGRTDEAIAAYRRALELKPDFMGALGNLGIVLQANGNLEEAIAAFQQMASLNSGSAEAHKRLGDALKKYGKLSEAVAAYRRGLLLNPESAAAHRDLGLALEQQGQPDEAIGCYRQAIELKPDSAELYVRIGSLLQAKRKTDEAVACNRQALQLKPDFPEAHNNLGNALKEQGKLDEAVACYRRALELKPDFFGAIYNLGNAFWEQGKLDEAIECFRRTLQLKPDYAEPHLHLGMALLQGGDLVTGWDKYEWRTKVHAHRLFNQPQWDGSPLAGRRILLLAEYGLGDTLQFVRYCRRVKDCGGYVMVACQRPLMKLLKSVDGIDELLPLPGRDDPILPQFDVYLYLMSLPRVFGTTLESIPDQSPYLRADTQLVEQWRDELWQSDELKIGIAWQGSHSAIDQGRSIPLAEFEILSQIPSVRLISLQKGDGTKQVQQQTGRMQLTDFTNRMDESTGPFLDTAAVMMNLDLVITSDTSIAHLAGSLGVPVWVVLKRSPDWRWLMDRDDSPWYPTMRLFRQAIPGDWAGVFQRVAAELRRFILSKESKMEVSKSELPPQSEAQKSLLVETSIGELVDKITILEIKSVRIDDDRKLINVRRELEALKASYEDVVGSQSESGSRPAGLDQLVSQLKSVNEALWQIEDDIRDCERAKDFGPKFVELARSVYRQNDQRAALKRQINELLGSRIVEEKSYRDYEQKSS